MSKAQEDAAAAETSAPEGPSSLNLIDAQEARTLRSKKLDEFIVDKMNKLSTKIRADAAEGYGQVAADVSDWLDPVYLEVARRFRKENFHVHFEDKEGMETDDHDPRGCKMIIDWTHEMMHAHHERDLVPEEQWPGMQVVYK